MNQIATQKQQAISTTHVGIGSEHGAKIAPQNLAEVVRFAEVMCKADIALPKHLRGNAGACMAVALQAMEWDMSPFAVASKSYAVNGQIAYEAQLIAAVVNSRSGIQGRLKYSYEGEGDNLVCTVTGKLDGEEYAYTSPPFGKITPKNSPLWKTDPEQQLGYYSSRAWARRYTPEVLLGVYDREEVQAYQGPDQAKDVTPKMPLAERLAAANAADSGEGFSQEHVEAETAEYNEIEDQPDQSFGEEAGQTSAPAEDAPGDDGLPSEEAPGAPDAEPQPVDDYIDQLRSMPTEKKVQELTNDFRADIEGMPAEDQKRANQARAKRLMEIAEESA
ncbi:recombinase RecT [Roseibium alexandrii]|uniref:recombinase RecT n=1 Tax=Roseibium alexandrii TaxID=388408 RepID=UPI0037519CD6